MPFSHQMGFIVFRILIPALLLSIQVFLYYRTMQWLKSTFPNDRWRTRFASGVFGVMTLALLFVVVLRPRVSEFPTWFLYAGLYPFYIWHGATLFIGLVMMVLWLLRLPLTLGRVLLQRIPPARVRLESVKHHPRYHSFDASRRVFLRRSMYGLTALSFGGTAYGMFVGKRDCEITNVTFPIRNLDPAFHGFTIALVSDIHSSYSMLRDDMEAYVRAVNDLKCDLVVVTGDFVNSLTEEVYPFAEAFSNLKAPFGVYGVMGNHDFFASEPEVVAREVDACGVRLLRNDSVLIKNNRAAFYLAGVDDVGRAQRAKEMFTLALASAQPNIPKILLVHRPYFLQQAAEAGADLVLSGHTHGGQVVLGSFGNVVIAPASLASRYVWGTYRSGGTQMYVNRGIGTVGLPLRINCPPEITRITLVSQALK